MQQRPSHQLSCLHPGRGGRTSRIGCRRSNPFQPKSFKTGILGWRGCLGLAEGYSARPLGKPCNTPSRGALCATGRQSVIVSITSSASALTLPLWCTIQGGRYAMLAQWSRSHSLPTRFSASPSSTTKRDSAVARAVSGVSTTTRASDSCSSFRASYAPALW